MHIHACMHAVCTACTAQPVMTAALCAPERLPQKHQSPLRRQNKTHRNTSLYDSTYKPTINKAQPKRHRSVPKKLTPIVRTPSTFYATPHCKV